MLSSIYSAATIASRIKDMADEINRDFSGQEVHIIITLTGAFIFAADLIRHLKIPVIVNFAGSQSFSGQGSQDLRIDSDSMPPSFGNKPVIIIEDIIANGETVGTIRKILADRFVSSIKVAALLKRQEAPVKADYCGFTIPKDTFVVGYGMDMDGKYRELPDIRAITNAVGSGMC